MNELVKPQFGLQKAQVQKLWIAMLQVRLGQPVGRFAETPRSLPNWAALAQDLD